MSQYLDSALQFFQLLEEGSDFNKVKHLCIENAQFQCDVLPMNTIKEYVEWMQFIIKNTFPGCKYEQVSTTYNDYQVTIVSRFLGVHSGEGGPVEATGKGTNFMFTFVITFNEKGKITELVKLQDQLTCYLQLDWPLPDQPLKNIV